MQREVFTVAQVEAIAEQAWRDGFRFFCAREQEQRVPIDAGLDEICHDRAIEVVSWTEPEDIGEEVVRLRTVRMVRETFDADGMNEGLSHTLLDLLLDGA